VTTVRHEENPGGTIRDSMRLKLAIGRAKIDAALALGGGSTIYGAHLLPHLVHLLPSIRAAGIRMIEITMGSIALDQQPPTVPVDQGGRFQARKVSPHIPLEHLATRVRQLREPLGDDVFLNVGAPGGANYIGSEAFTAETASQLSMAGADGLHVHLSSLDELGALVEIAHAHGLVVEAYINRFVAATDEFSYMGIVAETPEEVATAGRAMEELGVDVVGLMFSDDPLFYAIREASDELASEVGARLRALRSAVTVPISVEGQITRRNVVELRELGANIIVLGSQFDVAIEEALRKVVKEFGGALPDTPA
jgi:pentose-5-phosphate-3-epimerase